MVNNQKVRYTFAAVIIVIIYAQFISCKPAYIRHGGRNGNSIADHGPKHLAVLKAPDPAVVETVKRRYRARLRGRRPDQSNERFIWRSHPQKKDWSGPDTEEVTAVFASMGI